MTKFQQWGLWILIAAAVAMLAGCGGGDSPSAPPPTPNFRIAGLTAMQTVNQGSAADYTFTVTAENGYSADVTPTVSGLPAGAAATFQPATIKPTAAGATVTLTVTTTGSGSNATPMGNSTLTISAVSGAVSHQVTTSLVVTAPAPGGLQGTIQ